MEKKNILKWFGIIGFIAVIGFLFLACKKDSLDGTTWKVTDSGEEFVLKFNSPNFTISAGGNTIEGSYSISGIAVSIAGNEDFGGNSFAMTGTIAGNILTFIDGGTTMMFTKQ